MPIDLTCPHCRAHVPVTEARRATPVECPFCISTFTAFEELGSPRSARRGRAGGRRRDDDDEDDENVAWQSKRGQTSGSALLMLLVGGLGLLAVSAALGGTIYLMATDEPETASTSTSSTSGRNTAGDARTKSAPPRGGGSPGPALPQPGNTTPGFPQPSLPNPVVPPKPRDPEFTLRPVRGSRPPLTQPAALRASKQPITVRFPGRAGRVAVGGHGRYLVIHFPERSELGVFDVHLGQMAPALRKVTEPTGPIAAGASRVVVAESVGGERGFRVYTLPDLAPAHAVKLGPGHPVAGAALGAGVDSPLVLSDPFGAITLVDLTRPRPERVEGGSVAVAFPQHVLGLRAAADGGSYAADLAGGGCAFLAERNRKWAVTVAEGPREGPPLLSADGQTAYADGAIYDTATGQPVGPRVGEPGSQVWFVPATSRGHFLKLTERPGVTPKAVAIGICRDRSPAPGAVLPDIPDVNGLLKWYGGQTQPLDQHLFLVPEARLLAVIPNSRDKLTLYPVTLP